MEGTPYHRIRLTALMLTAAFVFTSIGCSDSANESSPTGEAVVETTPSTSSSPSTAKPAAAVQPAAPPNEVVAVFLEALRQGDREKVESLISKLAREEMPKYHLKVEPLGTPQAQFEVSQVEYPKDLPGTAYVACIWKEPTPDGSLEAFEVVWVTKKQSDGQWRVAGMAMEGPEQELVFFDFEKPAEMLKQRDAVAAAYEKKEQDNPTTNSSTPPAASTAQQPQESGTVRR